MGCKTGEWADHYGSQATRVKHRIGKVTNFFSKLSVAEIRVEEDPLTVGDEILITGNTTGVYEDTVTEIRVDTVPAEQALKGTYCSIPVRSVVHRGDQVFIWQVREESDF